MCEKCLISSQVELNLSLAEKAKAEAVAVMAQNIKELELLGKTELAQGAAEALKLILPQEQAIRGGSGEVGSAEAAVDTAAVDPLADLPPELRDLLEVLGGKGVQVEVVRFPRS